MSVLRFAAFSLLWVAVAASTFSAKSSEYSRWSRGPSSSSNYFPLGVWLQNPNNAERFKAAGINLYVGLYRGPTSNQLAVLQRAGMPVICAQNSNGLANKENPIIAGWMHNDEPDNAQAKRDGQPGWGPPVLPEVIVRDYERKRSTDPTRPVFLNLGQGVAWDNYIGRGVRRNHPEDYPEYIKGADIVSFDIYPAVHDKPEIAGKLEFVPYGVKRLREWSRGEKIVWNCIEASRISNEEVKPTVEQIRSEVWMSIIQGSRGIIYFVHQFKPVFKEASLLDDPELLAGVTALNKQIQELAPVLNSASITNLVRAQAGEGKIASMTKRLGGTVYIFAAEMQSKSSRCDFKVAGLPAGARVEVLGESRTITANQGEFADEFKPYGIHIYRIKL